MQLPEVNYTNGKQECERDGNEVTKYVAVLLASGGERREEVDRL